MDDFLAANDEARRRLAALVRQLTDKDLQLEMEAGWTVGAVLAHLAFWDLRALTLVRRWEKEGVGPSPVDADAINDSTRTILRRLPGSEVRLLVLEAATAIDHALEELPPFRLAEIERDAVQFHLSRALHRTVHVDEIEARLAYETAQT